MSKRKTDDDYIVLAKEKGWTFCGPVPTRGVKEKVFWLCDKGHRIEKTYTTARLYGCPTCSPTQKKTMDDYVKMSLSTSFEWMGIELPKNSKTKSLWKCKEGHTWETTYGDIKNGYGCPHCFNERRGQSTKIDRGQYYILAKSRGFEWVGPYPQTVATKTAWQCSRGHQWEAPYSRIWCGHGCPHCQLRFNGISASKAQAKIADLIDGEVNYKDGKRYIDVALPNERIAIEYDCWFWHAHKTERDKERNMALLSSGWRLIVIRANQKTPSADRLKTAILQTRLSGLVEIILDWGQGNTYKEAFSKQILPGASRTELGDIISPS